MKTITIRHSSNMELPKSIRSYIDSRADEFKELDVWTKIAQIAYRIKRGAGAELFIDFKEDIERHMENPAYGCYADTAKQSIASYIETLRTDGQGYMTAIMLPETNSFSLLFANLKSFDLQFHHNIEKMNRRALF